MKEKFQMLQVLSHNWIMGIFFLFGNTTEVRTKGHQIYKHNEEQYE